MTKWLVSNRTSSHPFGSLWTNESRSIGFIRISKCASSSVVHSCGLRVVEPIEGWSSGRTLFTILRDPADRLLSSIPETLKRAFPQGSTYSKRPVRDVEVAQAVYSEFFNLPFFAPEVLISSWFDLIKEHGFFDAHHEPMVHFLFRETNFPYGNPRLVPFRDVDRLIHFARVRSDDPKPRLIREQNTRRPGKKFAAWARLTQPNRDWIMAGRHPMASLISEQLGCSPQQAFRELYKNLLKFRPQARLLLDSSELYEGDVSLWNGLSEYVGEFEWPYLEDVISSVGGC